MIPKILILVSLVNLGISAPQLRLLRHPQQFVQKNVLLNQIPAAVAAVDLNPQYSYSYAINDPTYGDNKFVQESRDGDRVTGMYSLVDADGSLRTVKYTAGPEGYNAVVEKTEGFAPVFVKKVVQPIVKSVQPVLRTVSRPLGVNYVQPFQHQVGLRHHPLSSRPIVYPHAISASTIPQIQFPHFQQTQFPHFQQTQTFFQPHPQFINFGQQRPTTIVQQPQQQQQQLLPVQQQDPAEQPIISEPEEPSVPEVPQNDQIGQVDQVADQVSQVDQETVEVISSDSSNVQQQVTKSVEPAEKSNSDSAFTYHSSGKDYNFQVQF